MGVARQAPAAPARPSPIARRAGPLEAAGQMVLETWRLRNRPLIAFKDAKGIKDRSTAARAIIFNFLQSMGAGPIYREVSPFEEGTKIAKIAGSLRVQSSRTSCNLRALRPYIAKTRRNRDSRSLPGI
jgi:hypothetical protein